MVNREIFPAGASSSATGFALQVRDLMYCSMFESKTRQSSVQETWHFFVIHKSIQFSLQAAIPLGW